MSTDLTQQMIYEDPREASFQSMVEERLRSSRYTAAARIVFEAVRTGLAPNDLTLIHWIVARIGTQATQQVIGKGFAQLNSPCCNSGFEACDNCDGNGSYGTRACAQCATMGKLRCPFCNGSSLLPLADLPLALRPRTMVARIKLVESHETRMLGEPIPVVAAHPSVRHELRMSFLSLDKLLGVLENALSEMRQIAAAQALEELAERVLKVARKLRNRQLLVLRRLAECELEVAGTEEQRALAESNAAVLSEICRLGNLSRTRLAHPFLLTEDTAK